MSAIPSTCGDCEHRHADMCFHPFEEARLDEGPTREARRADPGIVEHPLLVKRRQAPPRLCPLRRAEELRAEREAGQVEGATWMQEEARTAACPVRALIPAAVCARARAKRVP